MTAIEAVHFYGDKARQHIGRVRLSHLAALGGVNRAHGVDLDEGVLHRAFADPVDDLPAKLPRIVNEIHLVALKANFELFLNRLLWCVWEGAFPALSSKISADKTVSLRLLARAALTAAGTVDARELVVEAMIPQHGLMAFADELKALTRIRLADTLNTVDRYCWPQVRVAFEVRHVIEHNFGRADHRFRESVAVLWPNTSWSRHGALADISKVSVDEEDVVKTYGSMVAATNVLATTVGEWLAASGSTTA